MNYTPQFASRVQGMLPEPEAGEETSAALRPALRHSLERLQGRMLQLNEESTWVARENIRGSLVQLAQQVDALAHQDRLVQSRFGEQATRWVEELKNLTRERMEDAGGPALLRDYFHQMASAVTVLAPETVQAPGRAAKR